MTEQKIRNEAQRIQSTVGGSYLDALREVEKRERQGAVECFSAKARHRRAAAADMAAGMAKDETLRLEQRYGIGPNSDRSHDSSDYRIHDLEPGEITEIGRARIARRCDREADRYDVYEIGGKGRQECSSADEAARVALEVNDGPLTDSGDAFFVPAPEDGPEVAEREKVKRDRENATAMRVATDEATLRNEREANERAGELNGTFTLTLKLGNAAFRTTAELAAMIYDTARQVENGETSGTAVEVNGNTVGGYSITEGTPKPHADVIEWALNNAEGHLDEYSDDDRANIERDIAKARAWLAQEGA